MTEYRTRWASPLGEVLILANDTELKGVWFHNQKYAPAKFIVKTDQPTPLVLTESIQWLERYFDHPSEGASEKNKRLPTLSPSGTEFQQQVWQALLKIPQGQTTTYGELAQSILKPKAVRAVAAAVGRNPISLLIPCHRVIGANGSLTGYAGGLDRKEALLKHEHASAQQLNWV